MIIPLLIFPLVSQFFNASMQRRLKMFQTTQICISPGITSYLPRSNSNSLQPYQTGFFKKKKDLDGSKMYLENLSDYKKNHSRWLINIKYALAPFQDSFARKMGLNTEMRVAEDCI